MNLILRNSDSFSTTSVGNSMRSSVPKQPNVVTVTVFPALSRTATNESIYKQYISHILEGTNSGIALSLQSANSAETNRTALHELRKLSGLTWEQLARLFNVSRRSLHSWASGQQLSSFNEESLNRLLGTIRYINQGSASVNRHLLLTPNQDGRLPFDLLIAGKYEEVKQIIGRGNAPHKPQVKPLSKDAMMSRMPIPPEYLVDARQDTIHREVGRGRPARTTRSRRNGGEQ